MVRPNFCGVAAVLVLVTATGANWSALAQESACTSLAWPLAREYAWLTASPLAGAETGKPAPLQRAVAIDLRPMNEVSFALPPEKLPKVEQSKGAVVMMSAPAASGVYQVTPEKKG